jgi:hypothetical protein
VETEFLKETKMSEPKLNNSMLRTFGAYVVVHSVECVDQAKGIFRGVQLVEPEVRSEVMPYVYFSRNYDSATNDLDKMFPEIQWDDAELIGLPFILVQKEKLLFGYMPSPKHGIIIPRSHVKLRRHQI